MAAKMKLNDLGKFIAVCLVKADLTISDLESLLDLPANSLNNIGRRGTRCLDERFLKLPDVLGLTPEENKEFTKLCDAYMQKVKPYVKYQLNPLGEFIKHIQCTRKLKNNKMEKALGLKENYLGKIMRRQMVPLNDNFLRFPEVFRLTPEETAEFKKLCNQYIKERPKGRSRGTKVQIPERLVPLLNIIKENAFMISDSAIHACVSCLKRDVERNLVTGALDS